MTSFITQEQAERLAALKAADAELRANFSEAVSDLRVVINSIDGEKSLALARRIAELAQARRDLGLMPDAVPKPE